MNPAHNIGMPEVFILFLLSFLSYFLSVRLNYQTALEKNDIEYLKTFASFPTIFL